MKIIFFWQLPVCFQPDPTDNNRAESGWASGEAKQKSPKPLVELSSQREEILEVLLFFATEDGFEVEDAFAAHEGD